MNSELPLQFKNRMQDMLGDEADAFFKAFSENEHIGIRINTLKEGSVSAIMSVCGKLEPVLWCKNGFYADKEILTGKHPYHIGGLFYFQEPSAMAPVEALDIKSGDYVLDLCAAPGGKATQAAEKLAGTGILVANEIIEKRSLILAENIARMGIKNAVVTNETPANLSKKYENFFDKIIVDAPCSGEGMFRKESKALADWSIEHTLSCANRQKKILAEAVKMLKGEGKLVYSTCTFAPCENEGVVEWVLKNYPEMELEKIELDGLSDANADWISSDAKLQGAKRIFPHLSKGEGHFLALFKKKIGDRAEKQSEANVEKPTEYRNFEKESLNIELKGQIILFGERLFLLPFGINVDKIKTELAGLFLGTVRKGRFIPSHNLCLSLQKNDFKSYLEVSLEDAEKFFHGETLLTENIGWTAVLYNGYPIGWGKASGGILKNHFPKKLDFRR